MKPIDYYGNTWRHIFVQSC